MWLNNIRVQCRKCTGSYCALEHSPSPAEAIAAERAEEREKLSEILEIYAGMEGFQPQTAAEAYCLRIIEQMKDVAIKAMAAG